MSEVIDVRSLVLNGGIKPQKVAIYIEELGGWFTVQELMGDARSEVLGACINKRTGEVDLKKIYTHLFVRSLRYPDPESAPTEPIHPHEENFDNPEEYDKALKKYLEDAEDYEHPFPLDHPHAGELVFQVLDAEAVGKSIPGSLLEPVGQAAMKLNALNPNDKKEKKAISRPTQNGISHLHSRKR